MHCPKCGQQQISEEIRYCSRCGFLLTGVAEVVANDGVLPGSSPSAGKTSSPRKRGIKQGAFIFLLSFLVVPILSMIALATNDEPIAAAIGAVLLICGGLIRIVYALMFESGEPGGSTIEQNALAASHKFLKRRSKRAELPAGTSIPAATYTAPQTGTWRDTNDLATPLSVTDSTTKLLKNELNDQ